jgi:hypothetical protein
MGLARDQFRESQRQFNDTFAEEQFVNRSNIDLANRVLAEKDIFEKLFGGGGKFGVGGQNSMLKASVFGGPMGAQVGAASDFLDDQGWW